MSQPSSKMSATDALKAAASETGQYLATALTPSAAAGRSSSMTLWAGEELSSILLVRYVSL
jgi:hypothetical protein